MSGIHHRNMGGLGACLLNDELYNEVICDGKHICNAMLELMFRMKRDPFNHFLMVSDCSNLSGAPVGKFRMMEGFPDVNITPDGYCLSDTGQMCIRDRASTERRKHWASLISAPLIISAAN